MFIFPQDFNTSCRVLLSKDCHTFGTQYLKHDTHDILCQVCSAFAKPWVTEFRQSRKPKSSIQQIATIYLSIYFMLTSMTSTLHKLSSHLRKCDLSLKWKHFGIIFDHFLLCLLSGIQFPDHQNQIHAPAVEAQSLHHWTPGKSPHTF